MLRPKRATKKKVRPRPGDQRGTKPQSRPLASIGGSNAAQLRVITWCDNETHPWYDSRNTMSELGTWANTPIKTQSSRNSAAGFLGLVVDEARDLGEALAVAAAADDVADAVVGPEQRAVIVLFRVSHLRGRGIGARGVDRETLTGGALIHQERGRTSGARQQPAADQLQTRRVELRRAYVPAAP